MMSHCAKLMASTLIIQVGICGNFHPGNARSIKKHIAKLLKMNINMIFIF